MKILRILLVMPMLCAVTCSLIKLRFSFKKSLLFMTAYIVVLSALGIAVNCLKLEDRINYLLMVNFSAFLVFYYLSYYRGMRFVFSFFTEMNTSTLCSLFSGFAAFQFSENEKLVGILAEVFFLFASTLIIRRFLREPMMSVMENGGKGFGILSMIPVSIAAASYTFTDACRNIPSGSDSYVFPYGSVVKESFFIPLLLLILFFIMVYVSLIHYFNFLKQLYEERYNRHSLELQATALADQCAVYDAAQERMRELRHDMRHHVIVLSTFLGSGQIKEAREYLVKLGKTFEETEVRKICLNPIVNSILSVFADTAEREHVSFKYHVDFPKDAGIDPLDLSVVLANALENAMSSCLKVEPERREIILNFYFFGNKLIFEVKNPYQGTVLFDENGLPKTNRKGHGLGSHSISAFAKKYHSTLDFKAQDGIFSLRILVDGLEGKPEEMEIK